MAACPRVFLDVDVDGVRGTPSAIHVQFNADNSKPVASSLSCLPTWSQKQQKIFGERGRSESGALLSYKGSVFHRIIKDFMIQGGDITNGDGTGGESIYGRTFSDELNPESPILHDRPCLLSMANRGPNTNSSQFFITSKPVPHLDGKHVVFGRIVAGHDVFRSIESIPTDKKDRPHAKIVITNCGELERIEKDKSGSKNASVRSSDRNQDTSRRRRHSKSSSSSSGSDSSSSSESSSSDSSSDSDRGRRHKKRRQRRHSRSSSSSSSSSSDSSSDHSRQKRRQKSSRPKTSKPKSTDSINPETKQPLSIPQESQPSVDHDTEDLDPGVPIPIDLVHTRNSYLDRGGREVKPRQPLIYKDATGRKIKGRGAIRFDRYNYRKYD